MSAHLTEEEQIETIKRWWKDYGKTVVAAILLGLIAFFGWNFYQNRQAEQADERSVVFDKLVTTVTEAEGNLDEQESAQLRQLAQDLASNDDLYADFAELHLAKLAVEQGDMNKARQHLQAVADGGSNEAIKSLANLRIARVLASSGDAEGALAILSAQPNGAFAAVYAEVRGDVLLAQNRLQDAQSAYQAALAAVGNQPMRRNILQLKLDNTRIASESTEVPGASAPSANPPAQPNPHAIEAGDA